MILPFTLGLPLALTAALAPTPSIQAPDLGLFTATADIGETGREGDVVYDAVAGTYTVTGGGENMWGEADAFRYVWREVSGDVALEADLAFEGEGGHAHRKAGVVIRQELEPGAVYADVVVHGDGLASLQYRESAGGETAEVQADVTAPGRIRIEKRGRRVAMAVRGDDGGLRRTGAIDLPLRDPFYLGLAVCAHDSTALETAVFSNVELTPASAPEPAAVRRDSVLESSLEILDIETGERTVVHRVRDHLEAPNWMPDGQTLLYNSGGKLYTIPVGGGEPTLLETGFAERINNDHGISPDGTRLVISDGTRGDGGSRIYTLPIEGGDPELVTPEAPSYWHGWSPDGETLAYVADREGDYDIYTIPVDGGEETRLTTAPGLDDGPDYTFDGAWIYFNSVRTGTMQIWRMRPDGTDQRQVTFDERNDWFPHPSPDGRWIVFVSYGTDVAPGDHPANRNVSLRILPIEEPSPFPGESAEPRVLADLFGGQGTINVPSWSPDSRRFAFVSYRFVEE